MASSERLPDREQGSGSQATAPSGGVVLVIPSLGAATLADCLRSVSELVPGPDHTVVVLSNGAELPEGSPPVQAIRIGHRLGFAQAVNAALAAGLSGAARIACLNDDAQPSPGWLGQLMQALDSDSRLGAVQGTVTTPSGEVVDGRGIMFDRFGLPVQVDRGLQLGDEEAVVRQRVAVSATACLYRGDALHQVAMLPNVVFDSSFGSYHEDLDLGLRLRRLGWSSAWIGGAPTRHAHSTTGLTLRWRHPWWLLANRWRALAGNLTRTALIGRLPILLRGELRAIHTLLLTNPRAALAAAAVAAMLPFLVIGGWRRHTPGPRLVALPDLR